MNNGTLKRLYYFLAVKDILEIFAETELGSGCEIDIAKVYEYTNSFNFVNDTWEISCNSETLREEIYQKVTDDILNGYPVWRLLILSEWTMNMLEREFQAECDRERKKQEARYKCYKCKYFREDITSLGSFMECKYEPPRAEGRRYIDWKRPRGEDFHLKRSCKNFEEKINETD